MKSLVADYKRRRGDSSRSQETAGMTAPQNEESESGEGRDLSQLLAANPSDDQSELWTGRSRAGGKVNMTMVESCRLFCLPVFVRSENAVKTSPAVSPLCTRKPAFSEQTS